MSWLLLSFAAAITRKVSKKLYTGRRNLTEPITSLLFKLRQENEFALRPRRRLSIARLGAITLFSVSMISYFISDKFFFKVWRKRSFCHVPRTNMIMQTFFLLIRFTFVSFPFTVLLLSSFLKLHLTYEEVRKTHFPSPFCFVSVVRWIENLGPAVNHLTFYRLFVVFVIYSRWVSPTVYQCFPLK